MNYQQNHRVMFSKLYYRIWIGAINSAIEKNGENKIDWKIILLIIFSVAQGINLLTLFFWLSIFNNNYNLIYEFNIFPGDMLDSLLSGFITLFLPFILVNYMLIFRKNRYKKYIKTFSGNQTKGKNFMLYFIISILVFILPIIIGKLYS